MTDQTEDKCVECGADTKEDDACIICTAPLCEECGPMCSDCEEDEDEDDAVGEDDGDDGDDDDDAA